jgi:hypothetical protein
VKIYDIVFNIIISIAGILLGGINLWNLGQRKTLIKENELLKLKLKNCERSGKI